MPFRVESDEYILAGCRYIELNQDSWAAKRVLTPFAGYSTVPEDSIRSRPVESRDAPYRHSSHPSHCRSDKNGFFTRASALPVSKGRQLCMDGYKLVGASSASERSVSNATVEREAQRLRGRIEVDQMALMAIQDTQSMARKNRARKSSNWSER